MAQAALENQQSAVEPDKSNAFPVVRISVEGLVYVLLFMGALVSRASTLDIVPLGDVEAHEALAALFRVDPSVPTSESAETIYPNNPLGALANMMMLTLLGQSDTIVRLSTAIVGAVVVVLPILYRPYIGRLNALLIGAGLAISPVALAASRTMSGMVWTLMLVLIGGWFLMRFVESRQSSMALGATVCGAGIVFLTSPMGILLLIGMAFGLSLAIILSDEDSPARRKVPEIAAQWPGFDAFIAAAFAVIIVSTVFFTVPGGLSAAGQVPLQFIEGLTERQPGAPWAYGLWVSLRYELGFIFFALIAVWFTVREGTLWTRFLTGWFLWGLLSVTLYPGATPDAALLVTVPAVGLTAALVIRMLRNPSIGFWQVPNWFVPVHALVVAGLMVALVTSLSNIATKLHDEAKIVEFAQSLGVFDNAANVRIGTIRPNADSSMALTLPVEELSACTDPDNIDPDQAGSYVRTADDQVCIRELFSTVTVQVEPLDDHLSETVFIIRGSDGELAYGPQQLNDGLLVSFTAPTAGEYRLELLRQEAEITEAGQYLLLTYGGNLTNESGFEELSSGAIWLRLPDLTAALRISNRFPTEAAPVVALLIFFLLPVSFFLGGALYGARAAWRGMGFGLLLFAALYGFGMSWQATTVYGGDVRELWYTQAVPEDYHGLSEVLSEMSRRESGTLDMIPITVEGDLDSPLGWALREFPNAEFVPQVNFDTNTPAVIMPEVSPTPILGAEYVGQELIFDYAWSLGSLNWTDFGAWLTTRRVRFEPEPTDVWRLWIRKDVYDVENVP